MLSIKKTSKDIYARYVSWRGHKENIIGRNLWQQQKIYTYEEIQSILKELINSGKPFFAGKIGANEQNLLHWGSGITIPTYPFGKRKILYRQTKNCASNAGIVPRNPESYRSFYDLFSQSLEQIDVIGIWYNSGEYHLVSNLCHNPNLKRVYFFDLEPYFSDRNWARDLEGKTVFLVTPFLNSCLEQYQKRKQIWHNNLLPKLNLTGYKFPYLFSHSNNSEEKDWSVVFEDIKSNLNNTEFDIAIIGCGGLSIPVAAYCKQIGKQAIHLGGGNTVTLWCSCCKVRS